MRTPRNRPTRTIAWVLAIVFLSLASGGSPRSALTAEPLAKACTVFGCVSPSYCDAEPWSTCNSSANKYCRAPGEEE